MAESRRSRPRRPETIPRQKKPRNQCFHPPRDNRVGI